MCRFGIWIVWVKEGGRGRTGVLATTEHDDTIIRAYPEGTFIDLVFPEPEVRREV